MGNGGLPGMGEVPEEPEAPRDRGKRRFLNFSLGEINWLNIGKGVGVVLLASLGAGYGNHVLGDKVYVADPCYGCRDREA